MGSTLGVLRTAAARIGVSVEEYQQRRENGEKWCTRCKEWRPVGDYGKDSSRGDGLRSTCRSHDVTRQNGPSRPERQQRAQQGQRWCRGCESWLASGEVTKQGTCRPCEAAAARERYRGPLGAQIRARVNARRRELDPIPPWWQEQNLARFNGLCAYGCGSPAGTVDHIWPVSRGGKSAPGNLVPACTSCNSSKKNNHPAAWLEKGLNAFPHIWVDVVALALEHGTDEWLESTPHV